jgi:hypothetical protein
MTNSEKVRELARKYRGTMTDAQYHSMFNAILEMAKWKDEQHEQSLIDLNCKLEEQQANYEELKKRYDEAVEREKIVIEILVDIAKDHNVDDKEIQDFLNGIGIKNIKK